MAPQNQTDKDVPESTKGVVSVMDLNSLRKCIPEAAFKKSLSKSLFYMFFDYTMWFGACYAMFALSSSPIWASLPLWQQVLATIVYWNIAGFFQWCIFVVGHDCGHTTFSNYPVLNDIIGHITHASIMVPFYSWQVQDDLFFGTIDF